MTHSSFQPRGGKVLKGTEGIATSTQVTPATFHLHRLSQIILRQECPTFNLRKYYSEVQFIVPSSIMRRIDRIIGMGQYCLKKQLRSDGMRRSVG